MTGLKISILLGSAFFVLGLITLPHYGINWDTINHLPRGQAYLHYFLTGKKDYSDLPKFFADWLNRDQWYWQKPQSLFIDTNLPRSKVPTRSMYQIDGMDFNTFIDHDGYGHPPLSDILSSAFNRVLFGKLRLINDIDSYRVYGIFLAASLVGLVYHWLSKTYGPIAGLFASLSLSLYPLFWSESHFNTEKDIPEAVFWSFMLFCVWKGISQKKWRWTLLSGLFFGLALGTKFNILFTAPVIGLWIAALILTQPKIIASHYKVWLAGIVAIILGVIIFVGSWPYLWADPITRISSVIGFYKEIGTTATPYPGFVGPLGISIYPLLWIIYTTPLVILGLSAIGLLTCFFYFRSSEQRKTSLLFFLWLAIPVTRVIWPGANVYGGIRQIMEYIPSLAIFAGLGAQIIYNRMPAKKITPFLLLLAFVPITVRLIQIHPYENVYFNPLIGGLSRARDQKFPYWGFSFGAPYRAGVDWLNKHAEIGARIAYAYELIPNFPRLWLRPDLLLHNAFRSGYRRDGEYAITLIYQGMENRSYYDKYLEKYLQPVYEAKVDTVAILKIWKNDADHLIKPITGFLVPDAALIKNDHGMMFDIQKSLPLSRLEISYFQNSCPSLTSGIVYLSNDKISWTRLPGVLPDDWRISALGEQPKSGHFIEPFTGEIARYIRLALEPINTCLSHIRNFKIYSQ